MNGWSWYWIGLGVAFLYAELYAVFDGRPADKLSQNIWRLQDSLPYPVVGRVAMLLALLFLAYHLCIGPRH